MNKSFVLMYVDISIHVYCLITYTCKFIEVFEDHELNRIIHGFMTDEVMCIILDLFTFYQLMLIHVLEIKDDC